MNKKKRLMRISFTAEDMRKFSLLPPDEQASVVDYLSTCSESDDIESVPAPASDSDIARSIYKRTVSRARRARKRPDKKAIQPIVKKIDSKPITGCKVDLPKEPADFPPIEQCISWYPLPECTDIRLKLHDPKRYLRDFDDAASTLKFAVKLVISSFQMIPFNNYSPRLLEFFRNITDRVIELLTSFTNTDYPGGYGFDVTSRFHVWEPDSFAFTYKGEPAED